MAAVPKILYPGCSDADIVGWVTSAREFLSKTPERQPKEVLNHSSHIDLLLDQITILAGGTVAFSTARQRVEQANILCRQRTYPALYDEHDPIFLECADRLPSWDPVSPWSDTIWTARERCLGSRIGPSSCTTLLRSYPTIPRQPLNSSTTAR